MVVGKEMEKYSSHEVNNISMASINKQSTHLEYFVKKAQGRIKHFLIV